MEGICRILKKRFPKKSFRKHFTSVSSQIHCVDRGFKPGFLFDSWRPELDCLRLFLEDLRNEMIVTSDLVLVQVEEDYFLLNLDKFLMNQEDYLVIDVGSNLELPKAIENTGAIKNSIDIVKEQLTDFSKRSNPGEILHIRINLPEFTCIPTIFGFLLGYPVVFYYNPEITNDCCLNNQDLQVFQLFHQENLLTSFSIPRLLMTLDVGERVQKWQNRYQIHEDFKIEQSVQNHPSLVL